MMATILQGENGTAIIQANEPSSADAPYSRLMCDIPDAPISPIPTIPITAASPGSMIPKNRSAADVNAIHNPATNRILFIGGSAQSPYTTLNMVKVTASPRGVTMDVPAGSSRVPQG